MANELIRVRDAARRLGVSYATLKQWIYKGTLRTVQTAGGHHRIRKRSSSASLAREGAREPSNAGRAAPREPPRS